MSSHSKETHTPDSTAPGFAGVSVETLVQEEGTIPFHGLTEDSNCEYPDEIDPETVPELFATTKTRSLREAISVLPQAGEETLWTDNKFVSANGDGTVSVDTDAIRDVHALDIDEVETLTGSSLEQLLAKADPSPLIKVGDHKDIVDERRLALHTLGLECKFRWQIASSLYNPGDMQKFFRQKIKACKREDTTNPFGWVRHYDWGGSVKVTTIYPSKNYEVDFPDDVEIDNLTKELTVTDGAVEEAFTASETDGSDPVTIYYGDRIGYDFRGTQTIWAFPVIFVPSVGAMIPLPEPRFTRKHIGDFMDSDAEQREGRRSPLDWHQHIHDRLSLLSKNVNKEVMRARLIKINFEGLPFGIADFYQYLGLPADYSEPAATRAETLAEPSTQPSLWNLQLSLKLALLDNFDGVKAADTFQEYQELAGQMLRFPAQQIQLAFQEYEARQRADEDADEEPELLDEDQQTLAESLEDVMDLQGITEDNLQITQAQEVEERVQQRLPSSAKASDDETETASD